MMKNDTTRALFLPAHKNSCTKILDNIDVWLTRKFEGADNKMQFRVDPMTAIFSSATEQRKMNKQVQFNAYAQRLTKKFCSDNPNEALDELHRSPSRPGGWGRMVMEAVIGDFTGIPPMSAKGQPQMTQQTFQHSK
jgi:hypothetical protein